MARVIKHFEGNGTSTPYTVPAGKVAQIQGLITLTAATGSGGSGSFRFGDTTVSMSTQFGGGAHWILNSDATHIQPTGTSSSILTTISMRAGSQTTGGGSFVFNGSMTYVVAISSSVPGAFIPPPAPRIYIGAGDSLIFTQGTDSYTGYNIIAIEEDV